MKRPLQFIKERIQNKLYSHIYPSGYMNARQRIVGALQGKDDVLHTDEHDFLQTGENADEQAKYRDDIFATYLNIPQHKRRSFAGRVSLQKSQYAPTKSNGARSTYYTFPQKNTPWNDLYDATQGNGILRSEYNHFDGFMPQTINENRISEAGLYNALGQFTIGKGYDPKRGEYISYYDKWDLAPFGGKGDSEQLKFKQEGKSDQSYVIGKPVEFYDRMYLDDMFGFTGKERGSYFLPEVTVEPYNTKVGGVYVWKHGGTINYLNLFKK